MTLQRLAGLAAGFGLLALAFGCVLAMVGLLLGGPEVNTLAGAGILILFGNLTFASTFAGLYLLDAPADQKSTGIRNLTPAGWGLVAVTANVMVGVAIGTVQFPEYLPQLVLLGKAAALIIGLPVFLGGWFVLSRFGIRIWRRNDA